MNSDTVLRHEIRRSLSEVRSRIRSHSGLYSGEDLFRDVLGTCDEMTAALDPTPRLSDARRNVEERCRRLAQVTNRFADRDPALIAAARVQALAAIDMFQDAVFELRKAGIPVPRTGLLLKERSL
jgi:hypothetical protein